MLGGSQLKCALTSKETEVGAIENASWAIAPATGEDQGQQYGEVAHIRDAADQHAPWF